MIERLEERHMLAQMVADILPDLQSPFGAPEMAAIGETLYFTARAQEFGAESLWQTRGTSSSTEEIVAGGGVS